MTKKLLGLFFALLMFGCSISSVYAIDARSSDYFAATEVWATATGSGKMIVEFDINATHVMTEVGAAEIIIYEKQSDGSYESVKTFTRYNTSGMIEKNTAGAYGIVHYTGKSRTKYYATLELYAKDANGYEYKYRTTNTITA